MIQMDESILSSIKNVIGITDEYNVFDAQIIMHINTAFSTLFQIGVGPDHPFLISGIEERWSDFMTDGDLEAVKTCVALMVRMYFDPPNNSFLASTINEQIKELQWRLNVRRDPGPMENEKFKWENDPWNSGEIDW